MASNLYMLGASTTSCVTVSAAHFFQEKSYRVQFLLMSWHVRWSRCLLDIVCGQAAPLQAEIFKVRLGDSSLCC